jgi:hypothetical protein
MEEPIKHDRPSVETVCLIGYAAAVGNTAEADVGLNLLELTEIVACQCLGSPQHTTSCKNLEPGGIQPIIPHYIQKTVPDSSFSSDEFDRQNLSNQLWSCCQAADADYYGPRLFLNGTALEYTYLPSAA